MKNVKRFINCLVVVVAAAADDDDDDHDDVENNQQGFLCRSEPFSNHMYKDTSKTKWVNCHLNHLNFKICHNVFYL